MSLSSISQSLQAWLCESEPGTVAIWFWTFLFDFPYSETIVGSLWCQVGQPHRDPWVCLFHFPRSTRCFVFVRGPQVIQFPHIVCSSRISVTWVLFPTSRGCVFGSSQPLAGFNWWSKHPARYCPPTAPLPALAWHHKGRRSEPSVITSNTHHLPRSQWLARIIQVF